MKPLVLCKRVSMYLVDSNPFPFYSFAAIGPDKQKSHYHRLLMEKSKAKKQGQQGR